MSGTATMDSSGMQVSGTYSVQMAGSTTDFDNGTFAGSSK
jgi:hypothetical protein